MEYLSLLGATVKTPEWGSPWRKGGPIRGRGCEYSVGVGR